VIKLSTQTAALLALCAGIAGCAGASTAVPGYAAGPSAGTGTLGFGAPLVRGPASQPHGHVYVVGTSAAGHARRFLVRLPIVNGIVSQQADSVLWMGDYHPTYYNCGLTVAPDGTIYTVNYEPSISVFAPGAHGHDRPIRRIPLSAPACALVLDGNGYLYAQTGYYGVMVIAQDGRVVNTIYGPTGADLALDPQGNLYDGTFSTIDVYATPGTNPTHLRSACMKPTGPNNAEGLAIATDGRLFISRKTTITRVADTVDECPLPRGSFNISLASGPGLDNPAIAVAGDRLFVINRQHDLLELDANVAEQNPLTVVHFPHAIVHFVAIGP
jgi:hypothetical protein